MPFMVHKVPDVDIAKIINRGIRLTMKEYRAEQKMFKV